MLATNISFIVTFVLISVLAKKVIYNKNLLDDKGNWKPGINLPSLKLEEGQVLKRKAFVDWCFYQVVYMMLGFWILTIIMILTIENRVFSEVIAAIGYTVFISIVSIIFVLRIYNIKRFKHKFIEKGEENEKFKN